MKKVLITVTGMSPQIITETLYALSQERHWIPTEIHALTTQTGAQKIKQTLLGQHGFFTRFCEEYQLPNITFDEKHIHVIEDENGTYLEDIRTPEQNNAAADKIVRFIHDACRDDSTELHVSIAGGRKSMGFYIGYALSLFGRRQDRLSHVLVEADFENHPDFFYPTSTVKSLNTPSGMKDPSQAKVMLADIPFVRMREGLPKLNFGDDWSFTKAVDITQQDLAHLDLTIDPNTLRISLANLTSIKLPERRFSIYWALAMAKLQGHDEISLGHKDSDLVFFKTLFNQIYFQLDPACRGEGVEAKRKRQSLENYDTDTIKSILQEETSRIRADIKKALGDYGQCIMIDRKGKNHQKKYALPIPAKHIHVLPLKR